MSESVFIIIINIIIIIIIVVVVVVKLFNVLYLFGGGGCHFNHRMSSHSIYNLKCARNYICWLKKENIYPVIICVSSDGHC